MNRGREEEEQSSRKKAKGESSKEVKELPKNMTVEFLPLKGPGIVFQLVDMPMSDSYDDVAEKVAEKLGCDKPQRIRFTLKNLYSKKPRSFCIRYESDAKLSDMLRFYDMISDTLYYEVLEKSRHMIDRFKVLEVTFHRPVGENSTHVIQLRDKSKVNEVLEILKAKVGVHHDIEMRLMEIVFHRIHKIFKNDKLSIKNIDNEHCTLRAEEICDEEKNIVSSDCLIQVYHFTKDGAHDRRDFGHPFLLLIREGDSLAEIKVRIKERFKVAADVFVKWKFVFTSPQLTKCLEDSDIVSHHFQMRDSDGFGGRDKFGVWEQLLGIEHPDTES